MAFRLTYPVFKSVLDKAFALVLIIILLPIMLPLALITGFYTELRLGKHAGSFTILKLKTMRVSRPTDRGDVDRITKPGHFLRRWGIDEIPQVLNILKGQMSFIGPRPLPVRYDNRITGEARKRFLVNPGISGLAQIKGRNSLNWRGRFEYDRKYAETISFSNDLKILIFTFVVLFKGSGVNTSSADTMQEFQGFNEHE